MKYFYNDTVKPFQILGGLTIVTSICICLTILLLSIFLAFLSAVVLGITVGLIFGLILLNSILSKYNKQIVRIEIATPHVLEELVTLFQTTGSVFESIEYVSKGDYGPISMAFAEMIIPLNRGTTPEQLLRQFAASQPSMTLRRGLLTFIQFIESSATNLESVINDAHEDLQRRYQRLTMQWESRMMVIAGVLVFLPIIFILGASLRGLSSHPLVLLLPISQFIFSKLMISALLPKELILLGE